MDYQYAFLLLMALFYLLAGTSHFIFPKVYYKATPPFAKKQVKTINIIVGISEILAAIGLLIPATRSLAAIGVIVLLITVFPVHLYMVRDPKASFNLPLWLLWLRIPLQLVLIAWAAAYV